MRALLRVAPLLLVFVILHAEANRPQHVRRNVRDNRHHVASARRASHLNRRGPMGLIVPARKRATRGCDDTAKNCKNFKGYCTLDTYSRVLRKYCTMGCGFCAPPPEKCKDSAQNCAQLNRKGFCRSSFMTEQMKRSMCAKTCNKCAGSNRPPADCTGAKEWNAECMETTCAIEAKKTDNRCVQWCQKQENVQKAACRSNAPATDCTTNENKYKDQCIEETCVAEKKADANAQKTQQCAAWCQKQENTQKGVCTNGAVNCGDQNNKYDGMCIEDTCKAEKQANPNAPKTQQCTAWCAKEPNKAKDVCKAGNNGGGPQCNDQNKYDAACIEQTCTAEKAANPNAQQTQQCATWCGQPGNGQKAPCQQGGGQPNCQQDRFNDACLEDTCKTPADKSNQKCKDYCNDQANLNKDACKCSDQNNKYMDQCIEATCAAEKQANPAGPKTNECQAWCGGAGAGKPACT